MDDNSFSSTIPTQIGRFTDVSSYFMLESNELCGDIPTEVSALSSIVVQASTAYWDISDGNSLGTTCPTTFSPTVTPSPTVLPEDANVSVAINGDTLLRTTSDTFLAHGWEPWTATGYFQYFDHPVLQATVSHMRGQTVRFGGITALGLLYHVNSVVDDTCAYADYTVFHTGPNTAAAAAAAAAAGEEPGMCPFSTGSLDALLDFFATAGVKVMFDFNEIVGRNCTHEGIKPWQPAHWCGYMAPDDFPGTVAQYEAYTPDTTDPYCKNSSATPPLNRLPSSNHACFARSEQGCRR
jgi:hypothetical protein